ncbi:MAG: group II intron reverse transcriptase/maturase [Chitinophagales bacterium]
MIEFIVSKANLNRAYLKVYRNKGAAGVDRMKVEDLKRHLQQHGNTYTSQIREGKYQASPILGVFIPKSNGKTRLLGIPTVTDRVIQQALYQMLSPIFEREFQPHSYGFRPHRSAHDALQQSLEYINEGYQDIVDIDLKGFFDEVRHDILMDLIYEKVKCPLTLKLIRTFLRSPILLKGKLEKRRKGVPQGSPLSPLLANILLNELDKLLETRGHCYIRYADDFSIYLKSKKAARRVTDSIYLFLQNKLKLPINREKSGIRRPTTFKVLGHGFVPTYRKGEKGKYQFVVKKSAWQTFKQKLKRLTQKTLPMSFDERITRIKQLMRGWLNYFKEASIHSKLKKMDEWLRNRLRYCIWHDWKKPDRKRKNLIRLGVEPEMAYAWSRSRMGGWRIAQSPILGTTITLKRLEKRGYESLVSYYHRIRHQ